MTRHRFIRPFDLSRSEFLIEDPDLIHQWQHVLRLKIGETIFLCDGQGKEASAQIVSMTKKNCLVRVGTAYSVTIDSLREVTLYFSPLKRENTELVLQKATEIGVKRFIPIICRRTIKQAIHHERLFKIIMEAAEQSGRGDVPVLEPLQSFDQVLKSSGYQDSARVLFELGAERFSLADVRNQKHVSLFIGPEGGWDPEEVTIATQAGCILRSTGMTTLRAETAAIVASALTLSLA